MSSVSWKSKYGKGSSLGACDSKTLRNVNVADHLAPSSMGRNGTEVFGKVFLAILILFASSSKAQHSFTCVFSLLDLSTGMGWRKIELFQRFELDIALTRLWRS